jgi:hypothetical protein
MEEFAKEFRIIEEHTRGDIKVRRHTQFNRINARTVEVAKNVTARLYGHAGKIILKKGSIVFLHGHVKEVQNNGGELYLFNDHPQLSPNPETPPGYEERSMA